MAAKKLKSYEVFEKVKGASDKTLKRSGSVKAINAREAYKKAKKAARRGVVVKVYYYNYQ